MANLTVLQMPLPWEEFDLPSPLQTRSTTLVEGPVAWRWEDGTPDFPIESATGTGDQTPPTAIASVGQSGLP